MTKKTFLIAALFIGILVCAAVHGSPVSRTSIGSYAPPLDIRQADKAMTLDEMRGNYVLLNFWSSTDAASREAANLYTAWLRRNPGSDIRLISVNFDSSGKLFSEIVRRDSLVPSEQFHVDGEKARSIIEDYGLEKGFGSVLISPEGNIIAHNPDPESLPMLTLDNKSALTVAEP